MLPGTAAQEQLPKQDLEEQLQGCKQEQNPKQGFNSRSLSEAFKHSFAIKVLIIDKVVKHGSEARVSRKVPRTDSQARFPRTGCPCCPKQLAKNNFPGKTSKNTCKQGDKQEQNPKQDYEKQVPKQGPTEQVSRQVRFPSKFRRNRLPRNRFASMVFQEQVLRQGSKNSQQNTAKFDFF